MGETIETYDQTRRANISMKLSEFEMPPMQDVLLIGKKAMIGVEAVKRMVNALSPGQYEVMNTDHPIFEAVVIRKALLQMVPINKLIPLVLKEGEQIANEESIIKVRMDITVSVSCEVEL